MQTQFALDLRIARRQSGYNQSDLAHLLNVQQSKVSDFETGNRRPCLEEIIDLSLIYARSFEAFFGILMTERQRKVLERLSSLPDLKDPKANNFNRPSSIARLKRRLEDSLKYEA